MSTIPEPERNVQVAIDQLSKSFGSVKALKAINVDFAPGITGLLGPNGAGKTTLIRTLATLLPPSQGDVRVDDWSIRSAAGRSEIRKNLGYLPQEVGLYPSFRVAEFVDYMAMLKGIKDAISRRQQVARALAAVDLENLSRRRIRSLSGGMRGRVGIAQAIVADPSILLLDEPTTGLDPEQRMRFRQLIASLGRSRTVILSTHLVEDVAAVCARVVVLWKGRVLFNGTPAELRAQADGSVWTTSSEPATALVSWRTDIGTFRVVGTRPAQGAVSVPPTLEDGYLLVTSRGGVENNEPSDP